MYGARLCAEGPVAPDTKVTITNELVALLSRRLAQATSETRAALTLINDGHVERGFSILLDVSQPIHEARALLQAVNILRREDD